MTAVDSLSRSGEPVATSALTCRLCGHAHRGAPLLRGQRALCVRCGTLLAKRGWFGPDAALAFAVTGAALAFPAMLLPFITVDKLGREHVGFLGTGAVALWEAGMRLLGVWVALCGIAAPALLLGTLTWALLRDRLNRATPLAGGKWLRLAHALEHWAMPEVHVLAVLVALIKLGSLVNVHIGPGFWCYVAMSVALLIGWRSFDLELAPSARTSRVSSPAP
jgi:paraquat-inducible protein A